MHDKDGKWNANGFENVIVLRKPSTWAFHEAHQQLIFYCPPLGALGVLGALDEGMLGAGMFIEGGVTVVLCSMTVGPGALPLNANK
ncbi:MAG TPA: hypothetical protein V6D22_26010 [Candidatus Obscuribacterales bacterium]